MISRIVSDRSGDIADIDRLEFCQAPADQRQRRGQAGQPRKTVGELILGAEHHRGTKDRRGWNGCEHCFLARGLGPRVMCGGILVGADRRNMHHPGAFCGGYLRHGSRAFALHGVKRLRPAGR